MIVRIRDRAMRGWGGVPRWDGGVRETVLHEFGKLKGVVEGLRL